MLFRLAGLRRKPTSSSSWPALKLPAEPTGEAYEKAVAALLPAVKVFQESPLLAAAPNAMCASVFRSIPAWLIESLPPISNRPGRAKIVTPRAADRR